MDLAILHEVLHTMGVVATCAPHHTRAGHASDSPTDLMYAGDEPWRPSVLDVGHDDYFGAHVPGCPDLSDSPYLEGATVPLIVTIIGKGRGRGLQRARSPSARHASLVAPGPGAGLELPRLGGACSGRGVCTVLMSRDRTAVATFSR